MHSENDHMMPPGLETLKILNILKNLENLDLYVCLMSEYARDLAMAHYKAVQEASTDPNPNPNPNPNLNPIEGMQRYERVK